MLSNFLIGTEKVVLFIDNNSYEPFAKDLMQTIARSTPIIFYPKTTDIPHIQLNYKTDIDNEILAATEKPNVLLAPVSKLALCNSVPDIIKVVHYLKQSTKIRQIFMWCSTKTIQDDKIIPFLQYLADIEVVLRTESHLQILTKRNTGSISRKEYQYTIGSNFEIAVREKSKTIVEKQNTSPAIDPESFATFKITAADSEQKSRDALKLPYERKSNDQPTSFIHYQPDSDDDFDDEDPDEDLNI